MRCFSVFPVKGKMAATAEEGSASRSSLSRAFSAVAGHMDSIFCGNDTSDGRSTLQKQTTAWEVLHYLAMHFKQAILAFVKVAGHTSLLQLQGGIASPNASAMEELVSYVEAIQGMRAFTPELFALRVPSDWGGPSTPALRAATEAVGGVGELRQHHRWLEVADPLYRALWAPLFVELFCETTAVKGSSELDERKWGIGLVDLTSGYREPAVMDVKVGFLRYNACTPQAKRDKINRKDTGSILRQVALAIGGLRRWVHNRGDDDGDGGEEGEEAHAGPGATRWGEVGVERQGKPFRFAITDAATMRCCIGGFFSTTRALAVPRRRLQAVVASGSDGAKEDDVVLVSRGDVRESEADVRRRRAAHAAVQGMLRFFCEAEEGAYLLTHFAIVASSVLCTYDAADDSGERCSATLIDLAMASVRRLNYSEEEVGFLHGLRNLEQYLV